MDGQLEGIYKQLGITSDHIFKYKLDRCKQPLLTDLEIVDIDHEGKPFVLLSSAAPPWKDMYKTAHSDGVFIEPFSGFRSYIYQKQLIARKLKQGKALEIIITETAIP